MAEVVVIVISNQSYWDSEFAWSLVCLDREQVIDIGRVSGQTIAHMRGRAVGLARKKKASHILMLDADQVYPPDTISRLLQHDLDIVGGLYPARRKPWYLNVHMDVENDDNPDRIYSHRVYNMPVKGVLEVDVLGLGGALIKLSVFDKLEPPYFDSPALLPPDDAPPEVTRDEYASIMGEEFFFAKLCRNSGVKLHCDTSLQYVHMASMGLVYDYQRGVKVIQPRQ